MKPLLSEAESTYRWKKSWNYDTCKYIKFVHKDLATITHDWSLWIYILPQIYSKFTESMCWFLVPSELFKIYQATKHCGPSVVHY